MLLVQLHMLTHVHVPAGEPWTTHYRQLAARMTAEHGPFLQQLQDMMRHTQDPKKRDHIAAYTHLYDSIRVCLTI